MSSHEKFYGVCENKCLVEITPESVGAATPEYVDTKHLAATATLSAAAWSSSAPYTQTIQISGILASDNPHVGPVYDSNLTTALAQKEAWAAVSKAVAGAGSITFTCFEDKPSVNIPIQIEVNR